MGINAKMNEFEAAMGLCMLDELEEVHKERRKSYLYYREHLKEYLQMQKKNEKASQGYAYFPAVLRSGEEKGKVRDALGAENLIPEEYCCFSLDMLPYVKAGRIMMASRDIASRMLVLPLYPETAPAVVDIIIERLQKLNRC